MLNRNEKIIDLQLNRKNYTYDFRISHVCHPVIKYPRSFSKVNPKPCYYIFVRICHMLRTRRRVAPCASDPDCDTEKEQEKVSF